MKRIVLFTLLSIITYFSPKGYSNFCRDCQRYPSRITGNNHWNFEVCWTGEKMAQIRLRPLDHKNMVLNTTLEDTIFMTLSDLGDLLPAKEPIPQDSFSLKKRDVFRSWVVISNDITGNHTPFMQVPLSYQIGGEHYSDTLVFYYPRIYKSFRMERKFYLKNQKREKRGKPYLTKPLPHW